MNRRDFLTLALSATVPVASAPPARKWPLGLNTYCLRFQRWNDRQLIDYCVAQKLDAVFLQDSLDAGIMDPNHWAEVRTWSKELGLRLETGGGAILPKTQAAYPQVIATLRKNIERAAAMGSPIVRALLASDRYSMPDDGPVERHIEMAIRILREVRTQVMDAGLKIGIENHKELQAWETRQLIEAAGKEFVGSYLDTGNPVFVAEDPLTTVEELGPYAVSFHLRDSVVYPHPDGIAVQWVPLGEGSIDFKALVARASLILPPVCIYCKPITSRPPVVLPVYSEEFWTKWFPRARSRDFGRFLALARRGRPYNKPQIAADLPEVRDRFMDALKVEQLEHMRQSLEYCRRSLDLGLAGVYETGEKATQVTSRRKMMATLAGAAGFAFGQGVSTRGIKPQPRGKPSGRPFLARFTDIAREAGLTAPVIYGGTETKSFILEVVGCGVAFIDYDNDGWMDLFILSGTRLEAAPPGTTNRLYKNNRDGTFTDVTAKAGLIRTGWASAVTVGDYNNDGFDDIFVTYYGQNVLYRNNGDGTFTDVTGQAGLLQNATRYGSGCTWVDYDRDGNLDLFVANYLNTTLDKLPKPGQNADCTWKGIPVNCGPRGLPTGFVQLFRNNGKAGFVEVSRHSGVAAARGSYPMTTVAGDFDNDGWPDIYVACDSTPSFLFRNNHDGTFREEGLERGAALSEDGAEQAGMGVGVGDYNLDGSLDLFKTNFADDTNVLYRNDGKGNFDDVTIRAGLGVETRYVAWGAGIVDLDNDGFPDLFVVNGGVYPEVERRLPAYPFKVPRLVFRNLGDGKFEELIEEAGPGIVAAHSSRGCAFGDFDNDGDLDVLVMNMNDPPSLLRNDSSGGGNWLKVLLIGTKTNRSAIGSRVIARYGGHQQVQEVAAQSSFYSVNDRRLHFGLGAATAADLTVRWTNGAVEALPKIMAGQLVTIREGEGIIRKQSLRAK